PAAPMMATRLARGVEWLFIVVGRVRVSILRSTVPAGLPLGGAAGRRPRGCLEQSRPGNAAGARAPDRACSQRVRRGREHRALPRGAGASPAGRARRARALGSRAPAYLPAPA